MSMKIMDPSQMKIILPSFSFAKLLTSPSLVRFNITPFNAVKRSLKKMTMYPKRLNDKSPNAATSAPCINTIDSIVTIVQS